MENGKEKKSTPQYTGIAYLHILISYCSLEFSTEMLIKFPGPMQPCADVTVKSTRPTAQIIIKQESQQL